MKYFGTDGARGLANQTLTATMAYMMGRYIGQYPNGKKNKILIARDTRISGEMLLNALVSGILASGSDVYDEGISTTPSISYLVRENNFNFGIMISASHNPYYDNGIKFFNNEGEKISADIEEKMEAYLDSKRDSLPFAINEKIGRIYRGNDLVEQYINFLVDKADNIKGLKVLADLSNGSASYVAPTLFERLGLNVTYLNDKPNGTNINDRCGSTHLDHLVSEIQKDHYDLGIAFDGDADRFLAVSPSGKTIDGDAIMYINAVYLKSKQLLNDDTLVVTTMSNIGLSKACKRKGIKLLTTDVGDKYVQAELKKNNLSLGGEQSGHIIFLKDLNTGDGLLTAIKLMNIMFDENKSIDELLEGFVSFPQVLKNITVVNKQAILSHNGLKEYINELSEELKDNGRILVRPSGTESLVRVMCEATSDELCLDIVNKIIAYIESINY